MDSISIMGKNAKPMHMEEGVRELFLEALIPFLKAHAMRVNPFMT